MSSITLTLLTNRFNSSPILHCFVLVSLSQCVCATTYHATLVKTPTKQAQVQRFTLSPGRRRELRSFARMTNAISTATLRHA